MGEGESECLNGFSATAFQGLLVQFDGGGEKKGIVGIVVGMVGIDGIVVGMVGNGMAGRGGRVTLGTVGKVGFGKEGIWVLGNGGCVVVGSVGRVGNGMLGSGGNVAWGSVGTEGNGGNVAVGRDGIVGSVNAGGGAAGVSNSWRAAKLILTLDRDNVTIKANMKTCLELAIVW